MNFELQIKLFSFQIFNWMGTLNLDYPNSVILVVLDLRELIYDNTEWVSLKRDSC